MDSAAPAQTMRPGFASVRNTQAARRMLMTVSVDPITATVATSVRARAKNCPICASAIVVAVTACQRPVLRTTPARARRARTLNGAASSYQASPVTAPTSAPTAAPGSRTGAIFRST